MTALLKTDYAALTAEVTSALSAIVEGLADLEARTIAAERATWAAYLAECKGDISNAEAIHVDWQLGSALKRGIESVRHYATTYHSDAVNAAIERADRITDVENCRLTNLNIEAAKTAEPIDSGFSLLSAHVVLQKGKPTDKVTVLYTANGVIYEANVYRDADTDALSIETSYSDGFERVEIRGGSDKSTQRLFWADMTAEDIGKAAHLRREIIWAARTQFDSLPKKRR